jgi:hypothetical protein
MVKALENVNSYYDGNIKFRKLEPKDSKDIAMATSFLFTLGVNDCRGMGSMTNVQGNRRSSTACWHVHGDFFDFLNEEAMIKSGQVKGWIRPGDEWNTVVKNGPMFSQVHMEDLCDC